MNEELFEKILSQILIDVMDGDYTALEELFDSIPEDKLRGFLAEDE